MSIVAFYRLNHYLLFSNVVGHLGLVKSAEVRQRQASLFAHVDAALGKAIADGVNVTVEEFTFSSTDPTWRNTTVQTTKSTLDF